LLYIPSFDGARLESELAAKILGGGQAQT